MSDATAAELAEISRGTVTIDTTAELEKKWRRSRKTGKPLRIKLGVDPTSADLHLGHAVQLRKLRQFQDYGHQIVLIIGDYTACVGDPSGRNKTRPQLTHDEVRANAQTYLDQAWKVIDESKTEVVYNGDWFRELAFLDVVRIASTMTVARILEREDFSNRYKGEQPISLHEFLYPLMQAHDSVEVKADVEIGGTDQTFNLLLGRDRMRHDELEPQVCMTMPLLVGTDGELKMSKSYGNYVGIDDAPADMFGKTMSIPDALIRDYYDLCTSLAGSEIDEIMARGPRDAKATLAKTIVELYHGAAAGAEAEEAFNRVFRDREDPEDMPEVTLAPAQLDEAGTIWIVQLIIEAGLAAKNNEARRKVEGGGVKIDGEKVEDAKAQIAVKNDMILRVGKKNFRRIRVTE
ncbi:MAG: tyrosine--tRNA ligase [Planctomycetota bacterium]